MATEFAKGLREIEEEIIVEVQRKQRLLLLLLLLVYKVVPTAHFNVAMVRKSRFKWLLSAVI